MIPYTNLLPQQVIKYFLTPGVVLKLYGTGSNTKAITIDVTDSRDNLA